MIAILILLSFLVPLLGALAIRRYWWIGVWTGVTAIVGLPVVYKLVTGTHDPMGWGFVFILVFLPAAFGSVLGSIATALRRRLLGPGEIHAINSILAGSLAAITISLGLMMAITA